MTEIMRHAKLETYLRWLKEYLDAGGGPTHFYDYPWSRANFVEAVGNFRLDGECGSRARPILVHPGASWFGGDGGHNTLFYLGRGGMVESSLWVPYYNDAPFHDMPGFLSLKEDYEAMSKSLCVNDRIEALERETSKSDLTRFLRRNAR